MHRGSPKDFPAACSLVKVGATALGVSGALHAPGHRARGAAGKPGWGGLRGGARPCASIGICEVPGAREGRGWVGHPFRRDVINQAHGAAVRFQPHLGLGHGALWPQLHL